MSIADRDPYQAREAGKYASPIRNRESIINLRHEHVAPLPLNDLADALVLPEPYQLDEAVRRRDAGRLLQQASHTIAFAYEVLRSDR